MMDGVDVSSMTRREYNFLMTKKSKGSCRKKRL